MANYENKRISDIFSNLSAKYKALRAKYKDTTPLLEKAVVNSIFYAFSAVLGSIWQQSVWIYKQCFPQTCAQPALKFWGNLVGVDYKYGVAANLSIKLTEVTAPSLSAGTIYKDLTSGLIYKTVSQVAAENGEIIATVECTTSGEVGNIPVGTELKIANPLDGIPANAIVEEITITGTEDEEVEDYRKRVLFKFRNKSQCGSILDYFTWTTEVPGIVDAFVYVLNSGIVKVFIVASGSGKNRTPSGELTPNPFPVWVDGQFTPLEGSGQMLAVANSIEGSEPGIHDRRPAKAYVELSGANYSGFSIELTGFSGNIDNYKDAIKDAIIEYLDVKRPHIIALNYNESNARINKQQLSYTVTGVIDNETFIDIILRDDDGRSIDEATLGIGCLAYLKGLTINGESVDVE